MPEPTITGGNEPTNKSVSVEDQLAALAKEVEDLKKSKAEAETETKKLRDELETKKSHDALTDTEREFYDTMKETDKPTFLKANADERAAIIESGEVVKTADGKIIRKSTTDPKVFALIKAQQERADEVAKELKELRDERTSDKIRKELEDKFQIEAIDEDKRDVFIKMYSGADKDERAVLEQFLKQSGEGRSIIDRMVQGMTSGPSTAPDENKELTNRLRSMSKQEEDPFGNKVINPTQVGQPAQPAQQG